MNVAYFVNPNQSIKHINTYSEIMGIIMLCTPITYF